MVLISVSEVVAVVAVCRSSAADKDMETKRADKEHCFHSLPFSIWEHTLAQAVYYYYHLRMYTHLVPT